jgi:hypothetical protein
MSMNYLNEGKRYFKRRITNTDESLIMEKESLEEYNEFLKNRIKELEIEIELIKQNKNNNE